MHRPPAKESRRLGGAKNHAVILPDADITAAADALVGAGFGSAGEHCMAISVAVVVGNDRADTLVREISQRILRLHIGPPDEPGVQMGHLERVCAYIDIGAREGMKAPASSSMGTRTNSRSETGLLPWPNTLRSGGTEHADLP